MKVEGETRGRFLSLRIVRWNNKAQLSFIPDSWAFYVQNMGQGTVLYPVQNRGTVLLSCQEVLLFIFFRGIDYI